MVMNKFVHKLAFLWMAFLSLTGFSKVKTNRPEQDSNKGKISRQKVVLLDEFEFSAFHKS